MSKIKSDTLQLLVDGRNVDIKNPTRRNAELSASLTQSENWLQFVNNPGAYASKFDLSLDPQISQQLSAALQPFESLDQLQAIRGGREGEATAWAVAKGAYSIADTKIAVAF